MRRALALILAASVSMGPLHEAHANGTGYRSVADALSDLKARPGMHQSAAGAGWTTFSDETSPTIWTFAPATDAAYPTVVKRDIVDRDGGISIQMEVLCEAQEAACQKVVAMFQAMNAEIRKRVSAQGH